MSHSSDRHDHSAANSPVAAPDNGSAPQPPVLKLTPATETENRRSGPRRKSVIDRRDGVGRRDERTGTQPAEPRKPVHAEPADQAAGAEATDAAYVQDDDAADGPIYGPRTINLPGEGAPASGGGGSASGLERRRGAGRRLSDFTRSAEEGELTPEQFLFVMAIQAFKRDNGMSFPAWTDVLEVIRLLGYRKTQPSQLSLRNAEDWREQPDTPANVRPKGWEKRAA